MSCALRCVVQRIGQQNVARYSSRFSGLPRSIKLVCRQQKCRSGHVAKLTHALPPTAAIEVTLADISLADAPAKVISTQRIDAGGKQPPFPYELPYEPAQIDQKRTYSVSARITEGSELLFISDTVIPVLTRGAPLTDVRILVLAMSR